MKPKVIVICGPTASGKTALSVELAKQIQGEIVSADSMQIYQELNIGSAKPNEEERQGIKHYLMDCIPPSQRYSVADYKKEALIAIEDILKKGKMPIVVGGTGLYIDALIYHISYPEIEYNPALRKALEKRVEKEGLQTLYEEAMQIDQEATMHVSKTDQKRILRVIEVYQQTGKTKTMLEKESRQEEVPYDYYVYGLTMERKILYDRINIRVDQMIKQGLEQEVKQILENYQDCPTAMQALGYKEMKEYLDGYITKQEAIEKIKQETRRYAKRQLTWFRKNKQTIWLDALADTKVNIKQIMEGIH